MRRAEDGVDALLVGAPGLHRGETIVELVDMVTCFLDEADNELFDVNGHGSVLPDPGSGCRQPGQMMFAEKADVADRQVERYMLDAGLSFLRTPRPGQQLDYDTVGAARRFNILAVSTVTVKVSKEF